MIVRCARFFWQILPLAASPNLKRLPPWSCSCAQTSLHSLSVKPLPWTADTQLVKEAKLDHFMANSLVAEEQRFEKARLGVEPWRKWGPYLAERQWGTVREDYSDNGNAWDYFGHDQARSRAYRWGEDGLAGISDEKQLLCFSVTLWNGKDPILKERLFGLTNSESNHGE